MIGNITVIPKELGDYSPKVLHFTKRMNPSMAFLPASLGDLVEAIHGFQGS
jgi:hypothetical protein